MTEEEIAAIAAQLRRVPEGWGLGLDVSPGWSVARVYAPELEDVEAAGGCEDAPSAALKAALDAAGVPE